jgi:hypothetical protein
MEIMVDLLNMSVPSPVGDQLVAKGLATLPFGSRDADEVVQFIVTATGFVANATTLVVSTTTLTSAWQAIIAFFRHQPRAERLRIQVGDHVDISIDLDWLATHHTAAEALVLRGIGESLSSLADRNH